MLQIQSSGDLAEKRNKSAMIIVILWDETR